MSNNPSNIRPGFVVPLGFACVAVFSTILFVGVRSSHDEGKPAAQTMMPSAPMSETVDPGGQIAGASPAQSEDALLGTDSSTSATELKLVLVSTQPANSQGLGTASIGTDPRNPQTYAAGAQLANGTLLREVHDGYVILERGARRSLLLVAGAPVKVPAEHRDIGNDSALFTVGGEEVVNRPLEKLATSREDLSEIIRAEPYFERDELAGLKIVSGSNKSKLAQLLLQPGDIVRTIEGHRIMSADAAWQTLDDAISSRAAVTIGVQRDGAIISMSLDGSRLAEPMYSFDQRPAIPGS